MSDKKTRRQALGIMAGAVTGGLLGPSINKAVRDPQAPPMKDEEIKRARVGGAAVGAAGVALGQMVLDGERPFLGGVDKAEEKRIWRQRLEDEQQDRKDRTREPD